MTDAKPWQADHPGALQGGMPALLAGWLAGCWLAGWLAAGWLAA